MNGLIRLLGIVGLALGLATAALTAETGRHQRVGGIDIYYGILSAEELGASPTCRPWATF